MISSLFLTYQVALTIYIQRLNITACPKASTAPRNPSALEAPPAPRSHARNVTRLNSNLYLAEHRFISSKCDNYVKVPNSDRKQSTKQPSGIFQCGNLFPYEKHTWHDIPTFQTVSDGDLWITSAFLDSRVKKGRVRIIVVSSQEYTTKNTVFCTLWYEKCKRVVSVKADLVHFAHWKPFWHRGYFYNCDTQVDGVPDYVSLSTKPCDNPDNLLEVKELKPYVGPTTIAHCLPTLHGLQDPYRMTEWLVLHQLNGIDHVYIYDMYSISQAVLNVINHFRNEGFVSVISWHITDQMAIQGFGQRAVLNDCTFRAYGKYKFISGYDIDEIIIPKSNETLKDFLNNYDKQGVNILQFNRADFCTNRPELHSLYPSLRTLRYTQRKAFQSVGREPKPIARPEVVIQMGVHNVEQKAKGARLRMPSNNEALCHHYRFRGEADNHCNMVDTTVYRFKSQLKSEVNKVLRKINIPEIN